MSLVDLIFVVKINWDCDIEYMVGILENLNIMIGFMGEFSCFWKDFVYLYVFDELFVIIGVIFFGVGVILIGSFFIIVLILLI